MVCDADGVSSECGCGVLLDMCAKISNAYGMGLKTLPKALKKTQRSFGRILFFQFHYMKYWSSLFGPVLLYNVETELMVLCLIYHS